jgi:membrane protein DedA with SNARE-associated domain
MNNSLKILEELFLKWNVYTLFFGLFLETLFFTGLFVPGTIILIIAGFFAAKGNISIFDCMFYSFAGTLLGDNLSYFIGASKLNKFKLFDRFRQKAVIQNIETHWYVVFFHFTSVSRMFTPFYYGLSGYSFKKWIRLDIIASSIFIVTYVGIGYSGGKLWAGMSKSIDFSNYIQHTFNVILGILIIKIVYTNFKRQNT